MKKRMHRILHKLKLCHCFNKGNSYRNRTAPKNTQNPTIKEKKRGLNKEISNSILPLYINPSGELIGSIDKKFFLVTGMTKNISESYLIPDIKTEEL